MGGVIKKGYYPDRNCLCLLNLSGPFYLFIELDFGVTNKSDINLEIKFKIAFAN